MKREDLRSKIIPTTIENTDEFQIAGNEEFNTTDLIYLDSFNEQFSGKETDIERRISATDYAKMNYVYICDYDKTRTGKPSTDVWLRSAYEGLGVCYVTHGGDMSNFSTDVLDLGICPSLHYHLPSDSSAQNGDQGKELEQFDIREVKDLNRRNYISYITNWGISKNKSR